MEDNTIMQEKTVASDKMQVKRKKFNLAKIIIPVVAILAVLGILTGVFFKELQGMVVQNFGTPQEYFKFVEKNSTSVYSKNLSKMFGMYKNSEKKDSAIKTKLDIKLGDQIITSLENQTGAGIDFDWLKKISIDTLLNTQGDKSLIKMMLMLSDTELFGASTIIDNKKQYVYLSLPNLTDKYALLENKTENDKKDVSNLINNQEFNKILPEEKEVNQLIDKYLTLILDDIDGTEKTKETVNIEGVEQAVTVLKTVIEKEDTIRIAENLLNELGRDKTIKKYIEDISAFLKQEGYIKENKDVYEDYQDELKDAIKDLKNNKNITPLTITEHVDSRHNIVGRMFEEDGDKIGYLTVKKGKEFATQIVLNDTVITGKGSRENNTLNTNFTVEDDNKSLFEVLLSLDADKLKDGSLNGRAVVNFFEETEKLAMKNFNIDISDYFIEIVFSMDKETVTETILLNDKNGEIISINIEKESIKPQEIETPNINDMVNSDDFAEYIDFTKLIDALRDAGAPSVLIDSLEQYLNYYSAA